MFNRIASLFALVAALLPVQAAAQGIDETINTIFADYTGWYVALIFADLPGTNFSWMPRSWPWWSMRAAAGTWRGMRSSVPTTKRVPAWSSTG